MQPHASPPEALEPRTLLSAQLFKDFVPGTFDSNPQAFFAHI